MRKRFQSINEARVSPYAKYEPSFGNVTKSLKDKGFSSAPYDTIKFIYQVLYFEDVIDDEDLESIKRERTFSTKKDALLKVLEKNRQAIEAKSQSIAKRVSIQLENYIRGTSKDRGREDKYADRAAAQVMAKELNAEDLGKNMSLVDKLKVGLDSAEQEIADSLQASMEDPTTIVEIKLKNPRFVKTIASHFQKHANAEGVEADENGNTVQFSVDPSSVIAKLVKQHGAERVEDALSNDVAKIAGENAVVIIEPDGGDEDSEEMLAGRVHTSEEDAEDCEYDEYEEDSEELITEETYVDRYMRECCWEWV